MTWDAVRSLAFLAGWGCSMLSSFLSALVSSVLVNACFIVVGAPTTTFLPSLTSTTGTCTALGAAAAVWGWVDALALSSVRIFSASSSLDASSALLPAASTAPVSAAADRWILWAVREEMVEASFTFFCRRWSMARVAAVCLAEETSAATAFLAMLSKCRPPFCSAFAYSFPSCWFTSSCRLFRSIEATTSSCFCACFPPALPASSTAAGDATFQLPSTITVATTTHRRTAAGTVAPRAILLTWTITLSP
mmetsp:Transcript_32064/g.74969  ORF Transcript_32064/g.74969 Transcript_32064/m.74969 type:complete len:250 (-) Transcript_32064:10-759(-)